MCLEHESSQDIGGKESRGGILKSEARYRTLEDIWLSSIHPYACEEEEKYGALGIEGYICGVKRDIKGLQYLHMSAVEDSCEKGCYVRGDTNI